MATVTRTETNDENAICQSSSSFPITCELKEDGREDILRLKSNCGALLARQYHEVLPLCLISYFILQLLVGQKTVCGGQVEVDEWV
jgi:hypothetical protein